ncbi:MAG TPA: cupin domain-containing protein [Lacunisphaera sp.]|nr:cupin domain-containing protein [Lacunisphaera sp.]
MSATSIIRQGEAPVLDVLGPAVAFLTPRDASSYCVLEGSIWPRMPVPLHSHPDDESFLLLSGNIEALVYDDDLPCWQRLVPGDFVHVPGGVKHAWRNPGDEPARSLIITTRQLGEFLREVGRPTHATAKPLPPSPNAVGRFTQAALARGHWLASPEENGRAGIDLSPWI